MVQVLSVDFYEDEQMQHIQKPEVGVPKPMVDAQR